MPGAPFFQTLTVVLLYFTTTVSLWAEEATKYAHSEQAPLLERLSDPKDWIIGFVVGIAGGLAAVALLSFRVPKLEISRRILIKPPPDENPPVEKNPSPAKPVYAIQVINKRKRWLVTGDAIDIEAELQFVKKYEPDGHLTMIKPIIPLLRKDAWSIPHRRRFGRLPRLSEYIFHIDKPDLQLENEINKGRVLRFRVRARDSFSNYGKIFTLYYHKKGQPRWWKSWWVWLTRFWPKKSQPPYPSIDCQATTRIQPSKPEISPHLAKGHKHLA